MKSRPMVINFTTGKYSQTMFIIVLCFGYLTFSNCAVIDKAQRLSIWDDDDIDWWKKFPPTRKPWVWEEITIKPFVWNEYTLPPGGYDYPRRYDTSFRLAIILPIAIIAVILVLFTVFFCKNRNRSNLSSTTLHPPPRTIAPPPAATAATTTSGAVTYCSYHNHTSSAIEKPPGYAAVVLGDFLNAPEFPVVKPKIPETPPPKYEEENTMRY